MSRERWLRRKDRLTTFFVVLYFIIVVGSGLHFKVLDPGSHQQNLSSFILIVVMALLVLVKWYFVTYAYRCPHCGHRFTIAILHDFLSLHWPLNKKLLRCPRCKRIGWMSETK